MEGVSVLTSLSLTEHTPPLLVNIWVIVVMMVVVVIDVNHIAMPIVIETVTDVEAVTMIVMIETVRTGMTGRDTIETGTIGTVTATGILTEGTVGNGESVEARLLELEEELGATVPNVDAEATAEVHPAAREVAQSVARGITKRLRHLLRDPMAITDGKEPKFQLSICSKFLVYASLFSRQLRHCRRAFLLQRWEGTSPKLVKLCQVYFIYLSQSLAENFHCYSPSPKYEDLDYNSTRRSSFKLILCRLSCL